MSLTTLRSRVQQLERELAQLQKQQAYETKKEAEKRSRVTQIQTSITTRTNPLTLASKEREIARLLSDIASIQGKQSDIIKKIGEKRTALHKAQADLQKEEERERKKQDDAQKRNLEEQRKQQRELSKELNQQKAISDSIWGYAKSSPFSPPRRAVEYDVFISHATEDKEEFVRPLADALQARNLTVWYDAFTLKVGDRLRRSIDNGLTNARYGVVVLSTSFFEKNWTNYELDGLLAREMEGRKVILPIWHKVTKDDVMKYSPSLVDKVALNSSVLSIEEIADALTETIQER